MKEQEQLPFDETGKPINVPVKKEDKPVKAPDPSSIGKTLEQAEEYVKLHDRLRVLAVKATNHEDWDDQDGIPYLEYSGATKIAKTFGISTEKLDIKEERHNDKFGEYILYRVSGSMEWRTMKQPNIGVCTTRDKFFCKRNGNFLPLSEIDLANIQRKAVTNFLNRGIKGLLGLTYTWGEIEEISKGKITQSKCKKHTYSAGTKGGRNESPKTNAERAKTWKRILALMSDDEESAKNALYNATTWKDKQGKLHEGKKDINHISENQLKKVVIPQVEQQEKLRGIDGNT